MTIVSPLPTDHFGTRQHQSHLQEEPIGQQQEKIDYDSSSIQKRIHEIRKSIRDMMEESLELSTFDHEALPGITVPSASSPEIKSNEKDVTRSPKSAFEIGMALFGTDDDEVSSMERDAMDRLKSIETDIRNVARDAKKALGGGMRRNEGEEARSEADNANNLLNPMELEREGQTLNNRIRFLTACSSSRRALDESNNDNMNALSSSTSSSSLTHSCECLNRAEEHLQTAESAVLEQEESDGREVSERIINSIRVGIRRRRLELQFSAMSVLDSCLGILQEEEEERGKNEWFSITVRENHHVAEDDDFEEGVSRLGDAYEALSLLSSTGGRWSKLDEWVEEFTNDIYKKVLKVVLDVHTHQKQGKNHHEDEGEVFSSLSTSVEGCWELKESNIVNGKERVKKLEWKKKSGNVDSSSWKDDVHFIQTVLCFIHEHVLLRRTNLTSMVGRHLFSSGTSTSTSSMVAATLSGLRDYNEEECGPLAKHILRAMWTTCIPSSASPQVLSSLQHLSTNLTNIAITFHQEMTNRGFINQTDSFPIMDFAKDFERKYAKKRRSIILLEGRNLLLNNDYHNTIYVGSDSSEHQPDSEDQNASLAHLLDLDNQDDGMSVFSLSKCSISRVAHDLLQLSRRTMDSAVHPQSAQASALLPPMLFRTSRDLFDLFRSIIPAARGREVATVPRTAAILHNDCVYFAHHLLTLGLEYRDKFQPDSNIQQQHQHLCTYIDILPLFRELADQSLNDMIEHQKLQLHSIITSRNISNLPHALRSNEAVVEWTDAETALAAGLHHLRHLSVGWKPPILSLEVYGRAMGNLADTVLMLFLDEIFRVKDLTVAGRSFVGGLFGKATKGLQELFVYDEASTTSANDTYKSRLRTMDAKRCCTLWDRFDAVGRFMDMSLSDISLALSRGVFRSVTGPELSRLIRASFADSGKRRALLQALTSDIKP